MALSNLKINTASRETVLQSFEDIAHTILFNTIWVMNDNRYEILDIEFYFDCKVHPDIYALPHTEKRVGIIRPHEYGVDISLGSNLQEEERTIFANKKAEQEKYPDRFYGGILIRGMIKNGETIIHKPQIWQEIIRSLKQTANDTNKIYFESKIFPATGSRKIEIKVPRFGLGDPKKESNQTLSAIKKEYETMPYRFILPTEKYFKKLTDKTRIIANSAMSMEEAKKQKLIS